MTEGMHRCRLISTPEPNLPTLVTPPTIRDLHPMEAALSIKRVSKRIFYYLEPEDLLRCRLVSSSWLRMATITKLKKSEHIGIEYDLKKKVPPVVTVKGRTRELKNFTDFIDGLGSHPCLYFARVTLDTTIAPNDFFKFFDRYGHLVNLLDVTFQSKENGEVFIYQMKSLLEFVTKLLTEQLPNLETLTVRFEEGATFSGDIDTFLLITIKKGLYCAGKQNQSLRIIDIYGHVPYEIVDAVCCLAPKLKELDVDDLGFWAKSKHRLYLLQDLNLTPSLEHWDKVDSFEAIVTAEEKVNPKIFKIDFVHIRDNPELWPQLANLLPRAFDKCCNSLEKLVLGYIYFLPETVLPRMPKVKQISFFPSGQEKPEWSLLPQGINIANTFPILHTIVCFGTSSVTQFLSLCKNEKVTSVKRIFNVNAEFDEKIFQTIFPNAVVSAN